MGRRPSLGHHLEQQGQRRGRQGREQDRPPDDGGELGRQRLGDQGNQPAEQGYGTDLDRA